MSRLAGLVVVVVVVLLLLLSHCNGSARAACAEQLFLALSSSIVFVPALFYCFCPCSSSREPTGHGEAWIDR
jgi:hypothetical protein